jgi:hypothetical protein
MIEMLRSSGVEPERISFMAPTLRPKAGYFSKEREEVARVNRYTVRPDELYKEHFLGSPSVESLLRTISLIKVGIHNNPGKRCNWRDQQSIAATLW